MDFASRLTRAPIPYEADRGAEAAALFPDLSPELRTLIAGTAGSSPYLAWINFGSLAFAQGARALRFSIEETLEIVEQAGFMRPQPREASMPYMRSPASRHSRMETVLAWCVAKQRAVTAPAEHSTLPDWLLAGDRPVPLLEDFRMQCVSTRIQAFLMSLVDGKRSVKDIAQVIVEQRLMAPAEAESAVRSFLARMYEDSRRRASF
jgi:hypothetical protein